MYKNLDGETFGIGGRQNEVIELALSFNFEGINVDISEMLSRSKASGQDFATRYIDSAKIRSGEDTKPIRIGEFKLPLRLNADKEKYAVGVEKLKECCEIAKAIGAEVCRYEIEPASDDLTYQENFEQHTARLAEIAEILEGYGIKLGVGFNAIPKKREGKQYEFIYQAEPCLTLIKSVGSSNVGLALDLWHWILGDGGIDQLSELKAEQIVSVRLADMSADADPAKVTSEQRALPGSVEGSKCVEVVKLLHAIGYEGPLTPGQSPAAFGRMPREAMVQRVRDAVNSILVEAGVIEPPKIPMSVSAPEETAEKPEDESPEGDATAEAGDADEKTEEAVT